MCLTEIISKTFLAILATLESQEIAKNALRASGVQEGQMDLLTIARSTRSLLKDRMQLRIAIVRLDSSESHTTTKEKAAKNVQRPCTVLGDNSLSHAQHILTAQRALPSAHAWPVSTERRRMIVKYAPLEATAPETTALRCARSILRARAGLHLRKTAPARLDTSSLPRRWP